ncbi:MAG: hypothetical protein CMK89_01795 [Pseudomonadales bacterium]|nr:hypothetical protein [Pseudomonadales bacterium]
MRHRARRLISVFALIIPLHAFGQPSKALSDITTQDIRQSIIGFVNLTTMPGVEGSVLHTSSPGRDGELWRSSLGFQAEFTLRDYIANGYWGAALVAGSFDDEFVLLDDLDRPVEVAIRRDIQALRGSLGLSFPMSESFKVRTYGSLILSLTQSSARATGDVFDRLPSGTEESGSNTESISGVATFDLEYTRWIQGNKLELLGQINSMYTDTFSAENAALTTWAWNESIMGRARLIPESVRPAPGSTSNPLTCMAI